MTIAAGFVLQDGILLCADSLITDGVTKQYGDKIFPWTSKYAAVCFALAGNVAVARTVIDECKRVLDEAQDDKLLLSVIVDLLRPIIREGWAEYVDARPYEERDLSDFQVLVAIATVNAPPALYVGTRPNAFRIFDAVES